MKSVSPSDIRKLVLYDADTGEFTWRARTPGMFRHGLKSAEHECAIWNAKHSGKPAFYTKNSHGYLTGVIGLKRYTGHRVAWAFVFGDWPDVEIDHINHIRTDNRISNLRLVSRQENACNQSMSSRNTSGVTGVTWYPPTKRWQAKIQVSGVTHHLGYFLSIDAAAAARLQAQQRFNFHRLHGVAA